MSKKLISIAVVIVVLVAAGAYIFFYSKQPSIPSELVAKRREVATIITSLSSIQDVDITPLAELESKKDYNGAVQLMDSALSVNERQAQEVQKLSTSANDLANLSVRVNPDELGTKSIAAFTALRELAAVEIRYFENRRKLFELTKTYYSDLGASKNPPIPQSEIQALVTEITGDFQRITELNNQFTTSIAEFDAATAKAGQ